MGDFGFMGSVWRNPEGFKPIILNGFIFRSYSFSLIYFSKTWLDLDHNCEIKMYRRLIAADAPTDIRDQQYWSSG